MEPDLYKDSVNKGKGLLAGRYDMVNGMKMFTRVSRASRVERKEGCPAVVLVHGLGISSRYMVPTALKLAPYCRVFAPDFPGFGKSSRPWHILGIRDMADTLNAWMDVMGLQRAAFIGNSIGCQAVVDLAVRYPHRVTGAVLIGPTFDRKDRLVLPLLVRAIKEGRKEPHSLALMTALDYISAGPVRLLVTLIDALRDPIEDSMPYMQAPVLIVRGGYDAVVPRAWAIELAHLAPHGQAVTIPGVPHAVNYSAPGKLLHIALPFLWGLGVRG